jgi:glycosyltransferase involved in cell wall biosynthesis
MAHFIDSVPELTHLVYGRAREGEGTVMPSNAEVWRAPSSLSAFAGGIRSAIREADPDVVHFHSSIAGAFRPLAPQSVRVVYSPHCYAFERRDISAPTRFAYKSAERLLSPLTDYVVAVSPHEANLAKQVGVRNVVAVSNFAPTTEFQVQHSATPRSIVTVGRISAQKDPALFAEVAKRDQTDSRFVWVGDGDIDLRGVLVDAGVEVTGWLNKASIQAVLQQSSLYLHTAAWEASPMSLAEALGWGVPVVTRDNLSLQSLGYEGIGRSADEIATAIRTYFSDENYRQAVLDAAARTAAQLSLTPTDRNLREAYGVMGENV